MPVTVLAWPLLAFALAWLLVRLAIAYAHRRGMLDQPGQRRSHRVATPRGGGIGVVVACALTMAGAGWTLPGAQGPGTVAALLAALALVAAAGWWDDHRPLGVLPRLAAQLAATALFSLALLGGAGGLLWLPVLVLAGAWSINLHNFMDGIDGLLAQQGMFVGAGLAVLAWVAGAPALAAFAACLAAACLGFWCYNRSPARIFMGDVGSGSIGLLVFGYAAMLWRTQPVLLWPALALCSAFVTDAGLTLSSRMLRGKRWYAAHREHLYQWLVRCGNTHARSADLYTVWNLLVAAPLAAWGTARPAMALPACAAAYALAAAAWCLGRRFLLRRGRDGGRRVAA
ncbi:glycosyl transferase family 4 [Fulvimonas soli]|nr:glycosyl transferase family 4 [Fulvimonas soli]TNY27695.1 glycosyl transferase family 4 [Fulvimonas soli]